MIGKMLGHTQAQTTRRYAQLAADPLKRAVDTVTSDIAAAMSGEGARVVEIDEAGWRIVTEPPVRFRRAAGMKPLPAPEKGGSAEAPRSFLNVRSDQDFLHVVAWALAVLRDRPAYPVLVLSGEQGSAESSFSGILRALLDPAYESDADLPADRQFARRAVIARAHEGRGQRPIPWCRNR